MSDLDLIPISKIIVPPDTPRTWINDEAIHELAASIAEIGQLEPIVVRLGQTGYHLIAGLRRILAHRVLNRPTILARIMPETYDESQAAALTENIQRENLPKLDEARALRELVDQHGWGIPKTAKRLGKSEAWVRGRLDLLTLPPEMADMVNKGELSVAAASELARIPDDRTRDAYARIAAQSGVTATEAARWRRQVESDLATGIISTDLPPRRTGEDDVPRNVIHCDACSQAFDGATVRILRLCKPCFYQITSS